MNVGGDVSKVSEEDIEAEHNNIIIILIYCRGVSCRGELKEKYHPTLKFFSALKGFSESFRSF